jgi:hypothetical protein
MIIWKTNYNIPKEEIDSLISDLKKDDRSFGKDIKFYSSYYLPVSERPEKKITSVYNDIITKGSKQLGLFNRADLTVPFWMQVYPKDCGAHKFHMHFCGQEILSWVHFLRPSSKKCFYFIDSDGKQIYPHQNEGDFIIFPAWAIHGVDPNTDDDDRVVVAGNILLTRIEAPETSSRSYLVNDNIILWETKVVNNIQKDD